jgi:hypothetical protein
MLVRTEEVGLRLLRSDDGAGHVPSLHAFNNA